MVWELIDISLVGGGNGKGRVEFRRDIKQISSDILQGIFSYGSFCRVYGGDKNMEEKYYIRRNNENILSQHRYRYIATWGDGKAPYRQRGASLLVGRSR